MQPKRTHNSHSHMQKHTKISQNNSKNRSQRKKNTPFLLSRSSKKRYGGVGFTLGVGAPGPRQLLEFGGRPPITDL